MDCAHCPERVANPLCGLCDHCRSAVVEALTDAPGLYLRAHQRLGARSQALSERVSSSRAGSKSPVRDDLLELSDDMARALQEWHATLFPDISQNACRKGYTVQHGTVALRNQLDDALRAPWGLGHARRVVALSNRLRHALGETPLIHSLAAPCPSCDTRALIRRDGADRVECRMCGAAWPEARYQLLARALVAEDNETITNG